MMKQIFSLIVTCLLVVNLAHSNSELSGSESIIKEGQSKDLEIFLLIGQSNMAGRATIEDQDRDSLQRVFLFTASDSREWEKAANPLNRYSSIRKDLKMQRLGPGYSFAKKIAESFPEKQFGLVVNAKGGTTLDEWLPGTHFYNEAVKRVRMAMEYGNLRGVVWHQGEGDINKTETYIERIRQLIESLRRDTGIPDLPFVAGQLSEDRPARIPFNEMIMHLPEKVRYTGVASSEGTSTFDDTHFDSKSQRLLGERYATEMVKLLSGKLSLTLNADDQNSSSNSDASSQIFQHVKTNFQNPERASGVNCWWWWLNGNVNKAAITKDLEAMKSRNFQGAMVFDAGGHNQRGNNDIPAGPLFGSDEWNELFVFALDEAKRVGLEIGFNIQSGWNLGGPRVKPEYTAKQITYSEIKISGNKNVSVKLDLPKTRKDFYRDIAVLAFTISDKQKTNAVITDLDLKLGYRELGASAPDTRFLLTNSSEDSQKSEDNSGYMVTKEDILDISSEMDANGNLNWKAPEGEWIILRIGYTCTDSHVSTSSGDWQGSVLDYMSKEAFDFYWNDVVEPIFKAAGDHVGTTLKYMETDSWECGGMNWTDKFAEEFTQYRGYDLKNYLPIAAGYVVDDIETSNAFLADFRKTLGDLVAYNHYAVFQEYAHKYNMGVQPESAGPHAGPLDGIKNYGFSDVVMSEFWSPSPHRPNPENRFFLKQASSAAHIYGKKIVGAESFTTIGPHWNDELWHDQKSSFDHEICAGLNRMYFHTFTSSPPEMGLPGQEYFAGTHVNPQVTWWKQSGAFIDYMHRTQSVVQEGKFIADVLYYYGDHVPNVFPYKHSDPAGVMPGFDYDVTDETIFLQLKVEDGKLLVPGGVKYRILVLPDHKVLSMAVLEKVEELLNKGVTVLGPKPVKQVSLVGGATAQKRFGELVDKIWGDEIANRGEKDFGKGKVAWGMTAKEYLLSIDVPADFDIPGNDSKTDFDYIHYTVGESDVYFVSNQTTERQIIDARFRVSGKQPELWDALTGNIREAKAYSQKDGLTTVPLTLEPYGAIMVVFNTRISDSKQGEATRNYNDYKTLTEINGAWSVYFDPAWGGPGSVTFPELMDWSQHSDEGVKYYSGTAVYNKTFHIDFEPQKDKKYFLQLGSVKDVGIAEVKINGKDKGVVWTSPFRVEISDELKKGENTLEIKVVNSWYNRVAGDQTFPDKKQYTSTNIDLKRNYRGRPIDEIPLESTGLLGPVAILEAKKEEKKVSIGLIGDSTVADEYGWGPAFSKRFSNNAHVINFAKNGATLQSLSGRLDELLKINPDYVLIQFGHNDQKRYDTDVYSEYLKSYIERVQKAGGIPVVVSSVVRRTFDENGKIISQLVINENYTFKANLEAYAHAAQTVARELKVPFIDLYTRSIEHHNKIGPEESMTYNFEENDKTHFSSKGAEAISDLIIKEIKIVLPRLTEYLK